jgi:UDP-N-acetylmuramoylalanine--D-glutamate ligase
VISEIEFAYRYCNGRIIGITGSNGKTTTTLLTHHILQKAGIDVAVGGNVGTSFAGLVADGDHAWYVLELSSFQLDGIRHIPAGHRDPAQYHTGPPGPVPVPHGRNYVASKFRIAMNQRKEDHFIHCTDDRENAFLARTTFREGDCAGRSPSPRTGTGRMPHRRSHPHHH